MKIQLGAPSLVSVIIPVFNGARSLETTVMNVLEQGYSNMEVLIGDNCSTDSTWQVIQKLTSTYPFIKAIRNTHNVGAIKNIENLFNSATGDLIWLRSSGDHYSKDYLKRCVEIHLGNYDIALTVPEINMYLDRAPVYRIHYKDYFLRTNSDPIKLFPSVAFYGVYKTKYFEQCMPFQAIYGSDLLFIHNLYMLGKVANVQNCHFTFESRKQRNTKEQDSRFFFGDKEPRQFLPRGLILLLARTVCTFRSKFNFLVRLLIIFSMFRTYIVEKLIVFSAKLIAISISNRAWRQKACTTLFNVALKEQYVTVIDVKMYWEHEICPRLRIKPV